MVSFIPRRCWLTLLCSKGFGFNEREVNFLSSNRWYALHSLFLKSYHGKFTDAYQPFGVGYDDLDKIPISDIYKKEGASPALFVSLAAKIHLHLLFREISSHGFFGVYHYQKETPFTSKVVTRSFLRLCQTVGLAGHVKSSRYCYQA
jgi:hypothetical protein